MDRLTLPFATGVCIQPRMAAEDSIQTAARGACSHTYIDLNHPSNLPKNWNPARMISVRDAAAACGIGLVVHGNLENPLACEDSERKKRAVADTMTEIHLASELAAPLVLHASSYFRGRTEPLNRNLALQGFIESLKTLHPIAKENGVPLWIENLPNLPRNHRFESVFCEASEYQVVFRNVKGVYMVYDVGHANVNGSRPDAIFENADFSIAAICFSDNDSRADDHKSLGEGNVNWLRFVNEMKRVSWRGLVVFETVGVTPTKEIQFLSRFLS